MEEWGFSKITGHKQIKLPDGSTQDQLKVRWNPCLLSSDQMLEYKDSILAYYYDEESNKYYTYFKESFNDINNFNFTAEEKNKIIEDNKEIHGIHKSTKNRMKKNMKRQAKKSRFEKRRKEEEKEKILENINVDGEEEIFKKNEKNKLNLISGYKKNKNDNEFEFKNDFE